MSPLRPRALAVHDGFKEVEAGLEGKAGSTGAMAW